MVEATFNAPSKPYHNATFSSVFQVRGEDIDSTMYRVSLPSWEYGKYDANVNVLQIMYDDGISAYKHPEGESPIITYALLSNQPIPVTDPPGKLMHGIYTVTVSYPKTESYPPYSVTTLFQVKPLKPPGGEDYPTYAYSVQMPGWVYGGYDEEVNKATAVDAEGKPYLHPRGEEAVVTYWKWNDDGELVQMVPEVDFNTLAPGTYLAKIDYKKGEDPVPVGYPALSASVLFQVTSDIGSRLDFELHMPSWVSGKYSASVNKPYLTGSDGSNVYYHPNGISPTFTYADMAGNPVTPSNNLGVGVYRVTASFAADGKYPAMTASTVFEVRASDESPSLAFEIEMPGWKVGDYSESYNAAKLIDTDSISYTIPRAELGVYSQSGKLDVTGHVPEQMIATNAMSLSAGEVPGYNVSIVRVGTMFQIQLSPATTVDGVEALIDAIGDVTYTAESEGRINAAKDAYMSLPLDQRKSVDNKQVLIDAISAFNSLQTGYSKILAVEQSINNAYASGGSQISVDFARAFFNAIGEDLNSKVTDSYLLMKMEYDLDEGTHPDFDNTMVFQANILGWEQGGFIATVNKPYLTQLGSEEAYTHPDGLQPTYRYYRSDMAEVALSNDLVAGRYFVVASFEASGTHPAVSALGSFTVSQRSENLECQISMQSWRAGSYNGQLPSMVDEHGKAYTHPDGIEPVFTYWTADGQEIAADKLGELTVGTYTVKATYEQTENYPGFTVSASFKVTSNSDAGLAFILRMPGWVFGQYDEDDNSPFLVSMDGRSSYLHPASLTPSYSFSTSGGDPIVIPLDELPAGIYRVTASFSAVEGMYPAISVTSLFQVKEDSSEDDKVFEVMMPGWTFGNYDEDLNVAKAIYPDGTSFDHPGTKTVSYTTVDGTGEVTPGNPMNTGVYKAIISYAESGTWPAMSASALFEVTLNSIDLPAIAVIMPGWVKGYYSETYNKPIVYYALGGPFTHPNGVQPQFTYSNLDGTPIDPGQLQNLETGSYNVTATYPASGQFKGVSTTSKFSVTEQGTLMFLVDMSGWEYGGYNGQVAKPVCMDRITPFVHPKGVQPTIVYMDLEMHEYTNLEELEPGTYAAFISYEASDPYPQCRAQKIFSVTSSAPTDILVCKVSMDSWEVGHFHGKAPTIKDQNGKPFVHPDGIQPIILYGDMNGNPVELSNDLPVGNYSVTVIYILSENYYPVSDTSYFRVYDPEKEPTLIDPKDISASFDSDRYDGERKTVNVTVGELVRDTDFTVRVLQEGITAIPIDSDYYDVMVILTNLDYMFEVDGNMVPCYTISMKINRGINEITDLKIRGWTVGSEPNKPVVTALFGADTVEFTYSSSELEGFVPEVPEEVGRWYVRAVIGGTDNYTFAAETVSFVISPEPGPPVDPTIVIVNPDGSITRELIETTVDPDGTETVTVDAVTTYPDGKYVESYSVTVSKDGESTMTEVSKIRSAEGTWSLEATIETERPFGPDITTTVTSDDGVGYAVSEALISGVQGWFVGGEEVKMALEQSQATVDLLGISGPVQWRIGLHTGSVVDATISSDSMAEIADKDANFVIRSDEGAVVYDNDALDTLASLKKDVSFEMRVDDPSTINHVQQMAIGDGHYVYVSTTVDGRYVTDLGGGTLSITIPFDEELDERSVVKAFYVDRDGHLEEVESRYSADSKTVTIITGHHSIYTLQVEELPMIVLGYGSLTLMVISAMAAAVLIASGYVIRTKRI
ncbi:MAG: hypothetical protein II933_04105 [Candidatus Methanomethylophilaceae archaeon]|nr:hypothetical protein [Candidatus Methanomethylophilaceae archaeon]